MLRVDRLSIHLPEGFEHRASDIAHELAGHLAAMGPAGGQSMDRLVVPALTVRPQATNREIAGLMAKAIHAGLGGKK